MATEEWLESANEALTVSLVSPSPSGLNTVGSFHPSFTYAIFGDDEKIYGYQQLKISLRFRANDMRPHLRTSFGKKLKTSAGETEPTDVAAVLSEGGHLPKVAFVAASDFDNSSKQLGDNWTPPGKLHTSIDGPDGRYEIWKSSLADPATKQLHSRIQILVPLLIEGGSYIGQKADSDPTKPDLSDANHWTLFFLYKTSESGENAAQKSYVFVGYATVYRFFFFQPPTPPSSPKESLDLPEKDFDLAQLPCRTRVSQFIILPPFQGKGNGARFYKAIFEAYHSHPQTHEFTVENPNEAFDDLRDISDLTFLRTIPEFLALDLDTQVPIPKSGLIPPLIVGGDSLESIRLNAKIAPRQFARAVEMHLMSKLPASVRPTLDLDADVPSPTAADKKREKVWQLVAKQRLYRHNRDVLSQIEPAERVEKLRETLSGVELEYARLLAAYERATKHIAAQVSAQSSGKRKLDEAGEEPPSKKGKTG